jgi:hypothetical protein
VVLTTFPVELPPWRKKLARVLIALVVSPDEIELESEAKSVCSGVELVLLEVLDTSRSFSNWVRSVCAAEVSFAARSLNSVARSLPKLVRPEVEGPPRAAVVMAPIELVSAVLLDEATFATSCAFTLDWRSEEYEESMVRDIGGLRNG